MQSTVQLISLVVGVAAGLVMVGLELRERRPIAALGWACMALSMSLQLFGPPSLAYVSLALSALGGVLIASDAWRRIRKTRVGARPAGS
jgi:hypothetical protein